MLIIVGLGNPGKGYDNTRHNIGFEILNSFAKKNNFDLNEKKFDGLYKKIDMYGKEVIFLKPQKYMNLSGEVIIKYLKYFNIDVNNMLVIHDDLDITIGSYKLKPKGSSAGHNGLKNIELNLNTQEYKRLKIGISNDRNIDTKDYVLGKFTKEEKEIIDKTIDISKNIIDDFITMDFMDLMNKYNNK